MSRRLVITRAAESDLIEAVRWYEHERSALGLHFLQEATSALQRALAQPEAYRLLRRRPHVRRVLITRFPYRIFYILRPDALIVFAVLHAKRQDRGWTGRI